VSNIIEIVCGAFFAVGVIVSLTGWVLMRFEYMKNNQNANIGYSPKNNAEVRRMLSTASPYRKWTFFLGVGIAIVSWTTLVLTHKE
jgi:hypothetical protein